MKGGTDMDKQSMQDLITHLEMLNDVFTNDIGGITMKSHIVLEGGLPDMKITNHIVETSCFYYATKDYEEIIPYMIELRFYNLLEGKLAFKEGKAFSIPISALKRVGINDFDNREKLEHYVREIAIKYLKYKYDK